jgi:chromosome segregation ATPase
MADESSKSTDYSKTINQLKENLDKAKNMRIRAETRMEQLNKQKQEILKEIEEMGVKPGELESEIEKLKNDIEEMIKEANNMLPMDLINESKM